LREKKNVGRSCGILWPAEQLAQWEQAIAPCQQALASNPKLSYAHFDLAMAYGWLGREAEAKAELAEGSDNPVFLQQFARRAEGLRKAGLPEE
jgi:tetratricopeptide (TPR) repeat protein